MEEQQAVPDSGSVVEKQPDLIITQNDLRFPLLQSKSQLCSIPLSAEDSLVADKMKELLVTLGENAVGLAGVQIGITRQIFVMKRVNGTMLTCINPKIVSMDREQSNKFEGCLSLPGMMFKIKRPKSLVLEYFDPAGGHHTETFMGMDAKVISHEMDHLNGRTITHHAELLLDKQDRLKEEAKRIKKEKKARRRRLAKLRR